MKYFFLVILLVNFSPTVFAQTHTSWNFGYGIIGERIDSGGSVAVIDPDNGIRVPLVFMPDSIHPQASMIDSLQFEIQGLAHKYSKEEISGNSRNEELIILENEIQAYDNYHRNNSLNIDDILSEAEQTQASFHEAPINIFAVSFIFMNVDFSIVTVGMPDTAFVSNTVNFRMGMFSSAIKSIEIDFGNGTGYTSVSAFQSNEVIYPTKGIHVVQFKIKLKNNKTYFRNVEIVTCGIENTYKQFSQVEGDPFLGTTGKINWSILYSEHNSHKFDSKSILNPIVFVEGFDPDNESKDCDLIVQGADFFSYLLSLGYDVIIVDYNDGGTYIQRNAYALKKLITEEIQLHLHSPKKFPLIGLSMGGVAAFYATKLANSDFSNTISSVISIDSPHRGAIVPSGIQSALLLLSGISSNASVNKSINSLKSPAARQMLLYNLYRENGSADYESFYNEYVNNVGLPNLARTVAFSSGKNSLLFSPSSEALYLKADGDNDFLGKVFKLKLWIYADGNPIDTKMKYYRRLNNGTSSIEWNVEVPRFAFYPVSNQFDYSGGGWRNTFEEFYNQVSNGLDNSLESNDWVDDHSVGGTLSLPNHCFIPFYSSIAGENDLFNTWNITKVYENVDNKEHVLGSLAPQFTELISEINFGSSGYVRSGDIESGKSLALTGIPEVRLTEFHALPGSEVTISPSSTSIVGAIPGGGSSMTASGRSNNTQSAKLDKTQVAAVGQTPASGQPVLVNGLSSYPNPFNPVSVISFSLAQPSDVTLEVYNILGQRVLSLVNEKMDAGKYTRNFNGSELASGVYFARLNVNHLQFTQKMLLMK